MVDWAIYYGDDSVCTSQDYTPDRVPARNVQVITIADVNHGWLTQTGSDYYVWDDRDNGHRWWGVDIFGLYDYLIEPGYKRVLFGRTVTSNRFDEIFRRANGDMQANKTGFYVRERKPK